jgi:hypothetical protein
MSERYKMKKIGVCYMAERRVLFVDIYNEHGDYVLAQFICNLCEQSPLLKVRV